jgi:hypothetical protein
LFYCHTMISTPIRNSTNLARLPLRSKTNLPSYSLNRTGSHHNRNGKAVMVTLGIIGGIILIVLAAGVCLIAALMASGFDR